MAGKRGPKPTPTKILRARGSWRGLRNPSEPQPTPGIGAPPTWLNREAKAEWRRVAKQLTQMGLAAKCDRAMLTIHCASWGEFHRAYKDLQASGQVAMTSNGNLIQHPLVAITKGFMERVEKSAAAFGFTPSARSRITVPISGEKEDDKRGKGKDRFFQAGQAG